MSLLDSLLIGYWPFVSSWMLLWGLAAAAPILIHLWNRRKYNEVAWAAMEFLLAAMRKNARRIQIEQWLLLAIRTLILLLLACALADPFLAGLSNLAPGLAGRGTHWVLVLDGSYSMQFRQQDKTRFQDAQELAEQLVDKSQLGDGFTLILMSDPPQMIVSSPSFDPADVKNEIHLLQTTHGGAKLSSTLAEVEKIIRLTRRKYSRLKQTKVCFVTDLGRTTWEESLSTENRQRVARIEKQASLAIFDVGKAPGPNLSIASFSALEPVITAYHDVVFEAEIQNPGRQAQSAKLIAFYVDRRQVREEFVNVSAGGSTTVLFTHRFETPGEHRIEARLAEDSLKLDNHRWISAVVRPAIRVMCVQGKAGAARFVSLALAPEKTDSPRVRPEIFPESALLEKDLNEYDCVFLCNVARFNKSEADALWNYVNSGGGLVFILGDQVQANNYNQFLGGEELKNRILPAKILSAVSKTEYRFDPLEYRHSIVAPFAGHEQSGLLTTPIWRYFQVAPAEQAKVALAFSSGDAALVEGQIGRGRSILLATSASNASLNNSTSPPSPWSAFYSWPSFPPLIQELLIHAVKGRDWGRNVLVGEDIASSVPGEAVETLVTLLSPKGKSERVRMRVDGESSRWFYSSTSLQGIYEARYGPPLSEMEYFAVNLDVKESSLERFDLERLPSQFRLGGSALQLEQGILSGEENSRLFRLFLFFMLVLLLAETYLAWRIGNASM